MNSDLNKLNGLNNQQIPTVEPTSMPTVEPTSMPTVEPTPMPTVEPTPMPTVEPTPMPTVEPAPMTGQQNINDIDSINVVSNLNKEEAMEEALSHTNQYSPFETPKQEVNKEIKKTNNKSAYIFIGIIFAILLLFIIFLPQISKLIGW